MLALAILVAIACLISFPGLEASQVSDDISQLSYVREFKSWKDCFGVDFFGLFRPLKNLIFYFSRDLPLFEWHALVLAAYVGSILAIYVLFRRLLGSLGWAFAGTLLWASSPTQVSTVVWMSAVNISLAMIFSCGCILLHDLSQSKPGRNGVLSLLGCLLLFLAQISYETAICVPGLCVLVDLLRKRPLFTKATIIRYGWLGLTVILYLAVRAYFGAAQSTKAANLAFPPDLQGWQLSLSAPWFLWRHFSMWLMPAGRLEWGGSYIWLVSASPLELAAAWAWLLLLFGVIFLTWKRLPMVAVGLLWFLAASFPPSNFIPIWSGPIEDYYLFFPSVGLVIALLGIAKALMSRLPRDQTAAKFQLRGVSGAVLALGGAWRLICIPLFWLQADLWSRPTELYLRSEATRPYQFQLQSFVARSLMDAGKLDQAKAFATKSYQTAPWAANSSMILGYVALHEENFKDAEKHLREALEKSSAGTPVNDFSRLYLAGALEGQGARSDVVRDMLIPLLNDTRSPYHMDAIHMQIECYLTQNQPENALRAARKAIQLHPNEQKLLDLLAKVQDKHPSSGVPGEIPRK